MGLPIDDLVVADGNREAFEAVMGITQREDMPVNIYLCGPSGSGKSKILQIRAEQRDLLSKCSALFTHAAELVSMVQLGSDDRFLESVGSVDILMIDSLDDFFKYGDFAVELLKLLLTERARQSLSTVLAGRYPIDSYKFDLPSGALSSFEAYTVAPLLGNDLIRFGEKMQDRYRNDARNAPTLNAEALSFIAFDFAKSLTDIDNAIHYLICAAGLGKGSVVDRETARKLLAM